MRKSKRPALFVMASSSEPRRNSCAPRRLASASFEGEELDERHLGPHRRAQLHRHVPEAAEPEHRHAMTLADVPAPERRVRGDARAEQRRDARERALVGDAQDEALVDDDLRGVAAVGRRLAVALHAVVGPDPAVLAILLQALLAGRADAARVDQAADTGVVAGLELGHLGAHPLDAADDLVAWHHGIGGVRPLVADLMDVRVADSAVEDPDQDVVLARVAALEGEGPQRRGVVVRSIAFGLQHDGGTWHAPRRPST
ncbi:MAG: hypothetical protein QM820_08030 [Minicystis sp.]